MTDTPTPPPPVDPIQPVALQDEMERSFLDYAMSVIVSRALPDVRDGLKPVHRRIIWDMEEQGFRPDRPHVKCARVTGDTMAKYHPHGNSAIYDALGAHGPAVLPPPPAHRLPRQLRLAGLRAGGRAVHGMPVAPAGDAAARRHRREHRRHEGQLRRVAHRAHRVAGALPQPAGQRQPGHRRGHGHEHPAPQPRRGDRRHDAPHRPPRAARPRVQRLRRADAVRQGTGLPHRRGDPRPSGDHRRVSHRPGQREDARHRRHRGDARTVASRSSSPNCRTRSAARPSPVASRSSSTAATSTASPTSTTRRAERPAPGW